MKTFIPALAILCALTSAAQAAPNDGIVGAYVRVEAGRSNFGLSGTAGRPGSDDHGQAAKLFGGYRFDTGLGIELGYAALGRFSQTVTVSGSPVQQDGKGRSLYAAATGRWQVGEAFAVHGRLGLSSGRVTGADVLQPADPQTGGKTSPLFGVGAEYRPRSNMAVTLSYDNYGKLSNTVKASALLLGLHVTL